MIVHLKLVEDDALRITLGTVPGTVQEVVWTAIRTGSRTAISMRTHGSKASGTAAAMVGMTSAITDRQEWKATCRGIQTVTRSVTPTAILTVSSVAVRDVVRSVIR